MWVLATNATIAHPTPPPAQRCTSQCPRGFKSRSSTLCSALTGSKTATRRWAPRKSTPPHKNVKRGVTRRERPRASCPDGELGWEAANREAGQADLAKTACRCWRTSFSKGM